MLHSFSNPKIEHTGNTIIRGNIKDGATVIVRKGNLVVNGRIGRNCVINVEGDIQAQEVGAGSTLTLPDSSNVIVSKPLHGVTVHKVHHKSATVCDANGHCHTVGQRPKW
jgi:uncharacterized protein (DUF342 family)